MRVDEDFGDVDELVLHAPDGSMIRYKKIIRAEWKYSPVVDMYKCSNCLQLRSQDGDDNYCPECGARMWKEEVNEDDYTKEGRLKIDG